jgi:hypothetical protein
MREGSSPLLTIRRIAGQRKAELDATRFPVDAIVTLRCDRGHEDEIFIKAGMTTEEATMPCVMIEGGCRPSADRMRVVSWKPRPIPSRS